MRAHNAVMAILKLTKLGHPVLARRAAPIADANDPAIQRLIADMIETLDDAGGVGLAAPQVHQSLRLFIYRVPEHRASGAPEDSAQALSVVINPEIIEASAEMADDWEGCLSIPGLTGKVRRPARILLRGQDETGAYFTRPATGFHARVIQHEADHLDGIVYLARLADPRALGFNEEISRHRPAIEELL